MIYLYNKANLKSLLFTAIAFFAITNCYAQLSVIKALCDNKVNPLGVSTTNLHFGWEMSSPQNNQLQTAYQLVISSSAAKLKAGNYDVWNSSTINSNASVLVPYNGKALLPGTIYYWKVRIWDAAKRASAWSKLSSFCTGLDNAADWKNAQWIGYEDLPDSMRVAPGVHTLDGGAIKALGNKAMKRTVIPYFRKEFKTAKEIVSAYAFVSGLGQYEMSVNGTKAGDGFLTPGWTYYDKTVLYNVLDIRHMLNAGINTLGIVVGNGFYNINRERYTKMVDAFGMPKLICRVKVTYADGTTEDIVSNEQWKTSPSPITFSSIYGGEDYDAQLEQLGWDKTGFNDTKWKKALLVKAPTGQLIADPDYPVAIMDTFKVKSISQPIPSIYMYDFGQNTSGIISLKVRGKKGQTVTLLPAEILNGDKVSNQEATGGPFYFTYILKGDGVETFTPKFTYYGFRYVQVAGAIPAGTAGNLPVIEEMRSLHVRNSSPQNGSFKCSNELFNRIYTLINWAIKSNYQSVVTDCPHREKLSWLEQDYLMGNSIHYNLDNYNLYRKLVFDLIDAQDEKGLVPDIAPEYVTFGGGFRDSPEWGSAAVVVPWQLYNWYGDKDILEKAYPMMKKYVAYLESKSSNHILSYGLGDWFDYGPRQPGEAQLTPKAVTATAIYYYDVLLLSKMAALLNKPADAANFTKQALAVKQSFNNKFLNAATNVYSTGSQTAMAMPLSVGLVDKSIEAAVRKNLTDSISKHNYALTAGDIGFHFLVDALDKGGYSDIIYKMNNRDDVPGYGYQLKKGATALTESWPALENVSNNHLMLGHIMEWFYSGLAGIGQEDKSVGFKLLKIRPQPVGDIASASGTFHTPYGWVSTDWKKQANNFSLNVTIPPNSSANVYLPIKAGQSVYINNKKQAAYQGDTAIVKCGSGSYLFEAK
ncbi:MAG: family 78 glycoside hydrolase catalytic domain [Bacteroidota bacterium]